jgi:hypothetical protein
MKVLAIGEQHTEAMLGLSRVIELFVKPFS